MSNINLRNGITRTLKYTIVTIFTNDEIIEKVVKGKTTVKKEMKEWLKYNDLIPTIELKEVEETRYMSIEQFIQNSQKVK